MQCRSKCYGGWQNGETCAVLEGGSVFSDPLAVDIHAAFASRYEGRGMGSRSLRPPSFSQACNVDQSAMAAGQTEKPARFWRMGGCSLIPWQLTDMQRLRRGMKAEVWGGHRQVKNGLPYLCFHTSTQTLHVSRLPGIREHAPILQNHAGFSVWPAAIRPPLFFAGMQM